MYLAVGIRPFFAFVTAIASIYLLVVKILFV